VSGVEDAVKKALDGSQGINPTEFESTGEWFAYMGDPDKPNPPQRVDISVASSNGAPTEGAFIEITSPSIKRSGFTNKAGVYSTSLYVDEFYDVTVATSDNYGSPVLKNSGVKYANSLKFSLPTAQIVSESLDDLAQRVKELTSRDLDRDLGKKVDILKKKSVKFDDLRPLRGSRFEQLIFKSLEILKNNGVFSKVTWNGKEGLYGLPQHSGPGLPDILVECNNHLFVIEATLLKGRQQWAQPEGASVPDHMRQVHKDNPGKQIFGLFVASTLSDAVVKNLLNTAKSEKFPIVAIETDDFFGTIKSVEHGNPALWITVFNHLWKIAARAKS